MIIRQIFKYLLIPASILIGNSPISVAQGNRASEKQIETEKLFIDATKEKILGNYENATYLFKQVLKQDRKNHAAAYELARLYDALEKKQKALASIKMAIAGDKTNPWYQMFLADVYDSIDKYEEGAEIFENLIQQDPRQKYYYLKQAYLLMKANKPKKAINTYTLLENELGLDPEIAKKKQVLYLAIGDTEKAIETYQLLIKSDPLNTEYQHLLADFYTQLDMHNEAAAVYQSILTIDDTDAKASLALAEYQKESGDETSYLDNLKDIFTKTDVNIDVKIKELMPYIQQAVNQPDSPIMAKTLELGKVLEKTHPKEAKSYAIMGDLLYYSNQKEAALQKYLKAKSLDNTVFSIYEQAMQIYLELGKTDSLLILADEAVEYFPSRANSFYYYGIALDQKNNNNEAIRAYKQGIIMSRKRPVLQLDLQFRLGNIYNKTGELTTAKEWLNKAIKNSPTPFPQALETLGDVEFKLNNKEAAIDYWKQALKAQNNENPVLEKKIKNKKL